MGKLGALITVMQGPQLMAAPSWHMFLWSLRQNKENLARKPLLCPFHWPKKIQMPEFKRTWKSHPGEALNIVSKHTTACIQQMFTKDHGDTSYSRAKIGTDSGTLADSVSVSWLLFPLPLQPEEPCDPHVSGSQWSAWESFHFSDICAALSPSSFFLSQLLKWGQPMKSQKYLPWRCWASEPIQHLPTSRFLLWRKKTDSYLYKPLRLGFLLLACESIPEWWKNSACKQERQFPSSADNSPMEYFVMRYRKNIYWSPFLVLAQSS